MRSVFCTYYGGRAMSFKEDRIDDMLRTSMFSNKEHQQALKEKLRSEPCELTEDELENVAGGVYTGDFDLLSDEVLGMVPR